MSSVRKPVNLDIKKEIFSMRETGKSVGDLRAKYGMVKSTISTILKIRKI
jgi:Mor family transcriptional regulator